jgi:3-methyl-2-oxobutanoate hydroxymethyltransferase
MSHAAATSKVTVRELSDWKRSGRRIAMTTAYDAVAGRLADAAGIDILLVGDTAAEVVLGYRSTVPVTLDEMLILTRSVSRVVERALVVGDLPFGAYEASKELAVTSASRLVKEGGADVVKLEGPRIEQVEAIVAAGMCVMGHLGLTPQSETALGGRKVQGRTAAAARSLLEKALALEQAGCFAVVFEAVPAVVAAQITERLRIPTIGIGAGGGCDGQVLVINDLLGMQAWAPRFVKRYADVEQRATEALAAAVADVRSGAAVT